MAVELSRSYRDDPRRWPFGAIVVEQGKVVGRGFNQVVELRDPSAPAEIMALRAAGGALAPAAMRGGSSWAGRRAVKPVTSTEWPACIFVLGKGV
jgi:guanine deaminase